MYSQLKKTDLKNNVHTSTQGPKECFNDMVFHHFVDELKHCNLDM